VVFFLSVRHRELPRGWTSAASDRSKGQGGQFDWGGRIPEGNGGSQRFSQYGRKSYVECKGKRELDCKPYRSGKDENRN
ncbi:hypothetical protein BGU33_00070, partial [Clostridioides difficile]